MIDELDKSDHALMDELLPHGASIEACRAEVAELAIRLFYANLAREDANAMVSRWRYISAAAIIVGFAIGSVIWSIVK